MEFRAMELQNSVTGTGKRRRRDKVFHGDFEGDNFVSSDAHLELVSSSSSSNEKHDLSKEESSSNTPKKKRKNSSTPSASELDEFFSKAERYDHKRFAEKYNYDIVKDVPIEGGSYQWIHLSITPTANQ